MGRGVWIVFAATLWALPAQAQVLQINEWSNRTQEGWDYSSPGRPAIDVTTNTPAGGGALKFTYDPGVYPTSTGGGRAGFVNLTGDEIYAGHWFKFSPGFTFNPFSTKIDYMWVSQPQINTGSLGAFTIREQNQGTKWAIDVTIQGNGQLAGIPHTVYATANPRIQTGVWYWIEYHVKLNSVSGSSGSPADVTPNGKLEVWVNDVLQGSWTNLRWRDQATATWKTLLHSPEWGGGGGTIPATQHLWYDHTVVSRNRIGMPGGSPGGDSCGDGVCTGDDTCSNCMADCGGCPVDGKPSPVTDLVVVSTGPFSADLSFTEVDDGTGQAAKYDVRFATPTMSWGSADSVSSGSCSGIVEGSQVGQVRTCTVTGLNPDSPYQFQLVGFRGTLNDGAVFGVLSNIASSTTMSDSAGDTAGCRAMGNNGGWLGSMVAVLFLVTRKRRRLSPMPIR